MRISGSILIAIGTGILIGAAAGISMYAWVKKGSPRQVTDLSTPSSVVIFDTTSSSPANVGEVRTDELDSRLRVKSFHESLAPSSDFAQRASLYLLLTDADQGDVERYIVECLEISSRNQRMVALLIVFSRYAMINPQRALDHALRLDVLTEQERGNLVWWIFNEWTESDLDAAVTAMQELPQKYKRSAAMAATWRHDGLSAEEREELARRIGSTDSWVDRTVDSIRRESYRDDPRTTYYELLRDTSRDSEDNTDLSEVAKYWIESEGVAVLREIYDSIESADARFSVLNNVLWDAIENKKASPTSLLHEVSKFPRTREAKQLTHYVLQHWANSYPEAAFEASLESDPQLVTDHTKQSILGIWSYDNPEGLFEAAMTFPAQFQGSAITEALVQISRNSPQEAIRLARNLDTRTLRTSARDAIVRGWRSSDAKAAFEWLMNNRLDVKAPRDTSLWHHTFSVYLDEDYGSARTYVDKYEGEFKDLLTEATAQHLIDSDVQLAIDYIRNLDLEMTEPLLHQIAFSFAKFDPMEALSYGETLTNDQQNEYFESVIWEWASSDFDGLFNNIDVVPNEYRSLAAKRLLEIDGRKYYLSDENVKNLESMIDPKETDLELIDTR